MKPITHNTYSNIFLQQIKIWSSIKQNALLKKNKKKLKKKIYSNNTATKERELFFRIQNNWPSESTYIANALKNINLH